MNLANHLEELVSKGFTEDHAETIVLMREAAIVLFDAFPETLLLIGGASLILFQESTRLSADLDLKPIGQLPGFDVLQRALEKGLAPLASLLDLSLIITVNGNRGLIIRTREKQLFTIDIVGLGSVIKAQTEKYTLEATGTNCIADVLSPSLDQHLLLKAETFLLRNTAKARDAYDIMVLLNRGAEFSGNLREHLEDQIIMFDPEIIQERIDSINPALCRVELKTFIPESTYAALERSNFKPLRDTLSTIFADWL